MLGLGVWRIPDAEVGAAVRSAIALGYRHIDTAQSYGNERGVGEAVRECGLARGEIFVTSKVAADHKTYDAARRSIDESLEKTGFDYFDLMIIHSPQPWREVNQSTNRYEKGNLEAYRALEDAMKEGKLRAIGVSNFLENDLANILDHASTRPAVNQILAHVGNTPFALIDFCRNENIAIEAYSPLGHGSILENPQIADLAKRYGVSVAQIAIKYCLQLGLVALPKTANPKYQKINAELDFTISEADIDELRNFRPLKDYGEASCFPVFGGKL